MAKILAFNGRPSTTTEVARENAFFTVYADGTLRYTQEGVAHFAPLFRAHGIDLRKIQTEDDHTVVQDICSSQSLECFADPKVFSDLDAQLLRALMSQDDPVEVERLQSRIDARSRFFELVGK